MNITAYELYNESHHIFPIERADYKRDWMDNYNHGFAYRCLPLKIANESGWLVRCPVDFSVEYLHDGDPKTSVKVLFEDQNSFYNNYILSHFGRGVVTFSIPYIFRTPSPWCLWARGYPNYYKENISFLEGIIETYWLHSTFTYNIRLIEKNKIVSFKKGEPLFFLTCININELNNSTITYDLIDNNPDLQKGYNQWNISRAEFNKTNVDPENWQKDYFKGIKSDSSTEKQHLTTIKTYVKEKEITND